METPKVLPQGTTQEQWDQYQVNLKNHQNWCNDREQFAEYVAEEVMKCGYKSALEKIKKEIEQIWFMDAPNEPGYYRANND